MSRIRPNVLLVDDVEANLVALEAHLREEDCELVRAGSGNEALRQLLLRDFAVILLDVQMPEMDGFEVASLARQNPVTCDVPIIFVTAMLESEQTTIHGYDTGIVDLLYKPVNPHVLRSKVRVFLDLHRSRRRLTEEIEAHKKTLAELDAFNYSVSHDLRAPLRALDGFSRALLEDFKDVLEGQGKVYLTRIGEAAQRMGQLIDDLLRLSQISRVEVRPQSVDLRSLAESVMTELRSSEPTRDVELVLPSDLTVEADARLLRIVVENLLRNAWKFTSKNARSRVELGCRTDHGKVAYFVRDDGVGFDATYADRLFQPFQRLHSSSQFEGTGIGLAIVQRIIHHHGGVVWAESSPNQGATFLFTLGS